MSRKKSIDDNRICERIKSLRLKLKLTGTAFAFKVGISQGYLSDIENTKSTPNKTLLLAISYTYNLNIDWLLTGEGEMTRSPETEKDPQPPLYKVGINEDPEIVDLVTRTIEVLKSNTGYTASLSANIKSFHQAIKTENRLNGVESRLADLEQSRDRLKEIREKDPPEEKEDLIKKRAI
jgi:transcriptional regulator with XRE-family HTH domain